MSWMRPEGADPESLGPQVERLTWKMGSEVGNPWNYKQERVRKISMASRTSTFDFVFHRRQSHLLVVKQGGVWVGSWDGEGMK